MSTQTDDTKMKLYELHQGVEAAKKALATALKEAGSVRVEDYVFVRTDGTDVTLTELFGDKSDLLVVHNMGEGCAYCTLWADGFTGLMPHILDRCGFALVSADDADTAREFSDSRGWNYPVLAANGSSFNADMGFEKDGGKVLPGVSSFHKNDEGTIDRIAFAHFGPGDDFCPVWPFLELLKDGANGWSPKFSYA